MKGLGLFCNVDCFCQYGQDDFEVIIKIIRVHRLWYIMPAMLGLFFQMIFLILATVEYNGKVTMCG